SRCCAMGISPRRTRWCDGRSNHTEGTWRKNERVFRRRRMKMYVAGEWTDSPRRMEIRSPYDGQIVNTVPSATAQQVQQALASAELGAAAMAKLPGYDRCQILHRAADLVAKNVEDLARTVTAEMGKPLK